MGASLRVLGVAALMAIASCAALPSGTAAAPLANLESFGGTPNGALGGQLSNSRGVASNQSGDGAPAGSVYVAEGNSNHRISQFTADGDFVRAWGWDVVSSGPGNDVTGTPNEFEICVAADGDVCKAGVSGTNAGQFNNPQGIAVDQTNGFLYVTSSTNRRVDVFSGSGQFAGAFGWDVDPAGAVALEFCTAVTTCKAAGTAGPAGGNFQSLNASIPSIDPTAAPGSVLVPDVGNARVSRYDTTISPGGVLTAVSFVKAFGWDVVSTGPGDDTTVPINELENCVPANGDVCKQGLGVPGGGSGQFGPVNVGSPTASAVDSTGAVYVASGPMVNGTCSATNPCRIQKFAPNTASATNFGPTTGPGQIYFESGASTAVAALSIAIDPSNDHVYVLRRELTTTYKVLEFDSTGAYVETHPSGDPLTGVTNNLGAGLAVGTEDRVYANMGGTASGQVYILGPVPDPTPIMGSVTGVGSDSATFNGSVEIPAPGSPTFNTTYHFEYSSNGIDWTNIPAPDANVATGATGVHNVTQTVIGLNPNTLYSVRLVASTGNAPVLSSTVTFPTDAVAPRVAMTFVDEVTQTQARLGAHIDPEGLDATYHFEWGTEPCSDVPNPCAEVPTFERQIGDGNKVVIVNDPIDGLDEESRYYYRVVATNSEGVTHGPDQTFETLNSCGLTDGRCYELVSPADKGPVGAAGGIVAVAQEMNFQVAPDRPALQYAMAYGAADATAGNEVSYLAQRDGAGWTSGQLMGPTLITPSSQDLSKVTSKTLAMSRDLGCGMYASTQPLADDAPAAMLDSGNAVLYRRNADGTWTTITDEPASNLGLSSTFGQYDVVGVSESCERGAFQAIARYPSVATADSRSQLYSWDESGSLSLVGMIPGPGGPGSPVAAGVIAGTPASSDDEDLDLSDSPRRSVNAVSADGSRVFFTGVSRFGLDSGQQAVFVREHGSSVAVDVSQSKTGQANDDDSVYQMATEDGSQVFFLGRKGLASNGTSAGPAACSMSGAGCDLYRYSVETDTLTDVTVHGAGNGPGVIGVLGVDEDGSHVYFASRAQLVPGKGRTEAENLAADTYSIYLSANGVIEHVGTFSSNQLNRVLVSSKDYIWSSRVTPDGAHLLFVSSIVHGDLPTDGKPQAFLFSEADGTTTCITCRRDGQPTVDIESEAYMLDNAATVQNLLNPPRILSEDGRRVWFTSKNRMATGATEGRPNLYQWEDGQISFVGKSAPHGLNPKYELRFAGASADGDDLYFTTVDRLTWQDVDSQLDVYDARVGGGFAEPAAGPAPCDPLAEASCQGDGFGSVSSDMKTSSSSGGENARPEARKTLGVGGLSAKARRRASRSGRLALEVRASSTGRMTLTVKAKVGKKARRVGRVSRQVVGGRALKVNVRLSLAARKRLRAGEGLRLTVEVRQSGARTRTTSILLPGVKS